MDKAPAWVTIYRIALVREGSLPCEEDRAITHKLVQAGKLLGIDVLDHVIIGAEGRYFSFGDAGLLETR